MRGALRRVLPVRHGPVPAYQTYPGHGCVAASGLAIDSGGGINAVYLVATPEETLKSLSSASSGGRHRPRPSMETIGLKHWPGLALQRRYFQARVTPRTHGGGGDHGLSGTRNSCAPQPLKYLSWRGTTSVKCDESSLCSFRSTPAGLPLSCSWSASTSSDASHHDQPVASLLCWSYLPKFSGTSLMTVEALHHHLPRYCPQLYRRR